MVENTDSSPPTLPYDLEIIRRNGYKFLPRLSPDEGSTLQANEILNSYAARASNIFGEDQFGVKCDWEVMRCFTKALQNKALSSRILTPSDLEKYAGKIMEIAEFLCMRNKKGLIIRDTLYHIDRSVDMITSIADPGENFDQDFDTLLKMLRESPLHSEEFGDRNFTILDAITGSEIKDLIRSSEDLERVGLFVKRLADAVFDARTVLSGKGADRERIPLFCKAEDRYYARYHKVANDQFASWPEIITDGEKLDKVLTVFESAFEHEVNPAIFVNGVGQKLLREATPDQLQQLQIHLADISTEVTETFGVYRHRVADQIFTSLNYPALFSRIHTPSDFRKYVDKVLGLAKLRLEQGVDEETATELLENGIRREVKYLAGQHQAAEHTTKTVAAAIDIADSGENFDRDFDTLLQMMRDNPSPNQEDNIIGAVHDIKSLIHSSEDLERVGQFVKRLSDTGVDAKSVLLGEDMLDDTGYLSPIFGKLSSNEGVNFVDVREGLIAERKRFESWQEIITDGKRLDEVLTMFESIYANGITPDQTIEQINAMDVENRKEFFVVAVDYVEKGISIESVLSDYPWPVRPGL